MRYLSKGLKRKNSVLNQNLSKYKKTNLQHGQALLVLLLAISVAVAVVLSSVSSSVTEVSVGTVSEESTRAFTAAEAGAERALILESKGDDPEVDETDFAGTGSSYDVVADETGPKVAGHFVYPAPLSSGEGATFWLTDRDTTTGEFSCASGSCFTANHFNVCWGNHGDTSTVPAIVVSVYYDGAYPSAINSQDFSGIEVVRAAYDADSVARGNGFDTPSDVNGNCMISIDSETDKRFQYRSNVNLGAGGLDVPCVGSSGCVLMVRARILYDELETNPVGIRMPSGHLNLPPQGIRIESTGTSGEASRTVEVFRTFPELPIPFESSIFSGGSIVK